MLRVFLSAFFLVEVVQTSIGETFGDYTYSVTNNGVAIEGYSGTDTTLVIPGEINGLPVTQISGYAISERTNLQTVSIYASGDLLVKSRAFSNCAHLRSVTMEAGGNLTLEDIPFFESNNNALILRLGVFSINSAGNITAGGGITVYNLPGIRWNNLFYCNHRLPIERKAEA